MQAYAYVSAQVGNAFDGYARDCGLTSKSELLKLLIERELRLRRLERPGNMMARNRRSASRDSKITTHLPSRLSERFDAHSQSLGYSKSATAALLVEAELTERWLANAMEWEPAA